MTTSSLRPFRALSVAYVFAFALASAAALTAFVVACDPPTSSRPPESPLTPDPAVPGPSPAPSGEEGGAPAHPAAPAPSISAQPGDIQL